MNTLEELRQYFPSGTTEGEMNLLPTAFVFDYAFVKAIAPPYGSPRLLVGKKGAGKTALVEFLKWKLKSDQIPVVLLRPDDFDTSAMGSTSDLATIKKAAFSFLALAVASRLSEAGTLATGHKRTLDAASKLYDSGKLDGVQKLTRVLLPVGKALSGVDFQAMLPNDIPKPAEIATAIRTELGSVEKIAYVLIDDTDQIGAPREANYLARIWGLLLGLRKLAQEVPNLKCLVTLRTEVWRRLRWDSRGQRDQVDHFQPLVTEWAPDDAQIQRIWKRRLELAAGSRDPIATYFASSTVDLPGTEAQHRLWGDFVVKNSRERPRDMVQFMGQLIERAIRDNATRIESSHMEAVIPMYSTERVDYLAEEFAYDCDAMKEIVRSLSRQPNVIGAEDLMRHLQSLPSAFRISVRGRTLQGDSREDAFVLWALLHESGIVNALVADDRQIRGFRHINHGDDAALVTPARWNEMQKAQWEIHPAFRSFLKKERDAQAAAYGTSGAEVLRRRRK